MNNTDFIKFGRYKAIKSKNAFDIIEIGKYCGLPDVSRWISPNKLQYQLDNENFICYLVGPNDAEIVTMDSSAFFGIIMFGFEEEGRIWIELLGVRSSHRRKRVATSLIQLLEQQAKNMGSRSVFVDVDDDNYGAQKFYKAVNFVKSGKISKYYYDGSDAIIFRKDL